MTEIYIVMKRKRAPYIQYICTDAAAALVCVSICIGYSILCTWAPSGPDFLTYRDMPTGSVYIYTYIFCI